MILALLGNPNSGKTTLFNALTGMRQRAGNFPGVTVDSAKGRLLWNSRVTVVDLPGTYTLTAFSPEEKVSGDFLFMARPDAILNVVDATSPARGLYLTLQLLSLGIPMAVAMNMMDEVEASGGAMDCAALSKGLGVPVISLSAIRGAGVAEAAEAALTAKAPESALVPADGLSLEERILRRYEVIESLCEKAHVMGESAAQRRSAQADKLLTHRIFAFPIFILVMGLVFYLTFGPVGGALGVGFRAAVETVVAWIGQGLRFVGVAPWLQAMLLEGVLAGVGSVLSFLPTILTLFFLLSLLEDSGYMARMAFVTDRLLRRFGLSGRSFVPALLGFGCSVPAILATRTLPSRRDRRMTILLIPFLSCSAKLPIYAMFAQAFFPGHAALVMMALYLFGVLMGGVAALFLKGIAFPGKPAPFLLELPAYRMPTLKSALLMVRARSFAFLRCAMTTLLIASIGIWALQQVDFSLMPTPDSGQSALASIGRLLAPIFLPLGFGTWQASTSLLAGLMAKEGILSSLSILLKAPTEAALQAALAKLFTPLQAVSYLVFILLYTTCVGAFAAARRELGGFRYALAGAVFQTFTAWLVASIVYSAGRLFGF